MKRAITFLTALLVLLIMSGVTGCATSGLTTKPDRQINTAVEKSSVTEAIAKLQAREAFLSVRARAWSLEGIARLSIKHQAPETIDFLWQQSLDSWLLAFQKKNTPRQAVLRSSRGWFWIKDDDTLEATTKKNVESRLAETTGVSIEWTRLIAWGMGQRDRTDDTVTFSPDGTLEKIQSKDGAWRVSYIQWMRGEVTLPEVILFEGPRGIRLHIQAKKWQLRNPSPELPGLIF